MLPMTELEYTGITDTLNALDARFAVREAREVLGEVSGSLEFVGRH
jgi:hypothetical protein